MEKKPTLGGLDKQHLHPLLHSASTQTILIHDGGDGAGDGDAGSATDASVSHDNTESLTLHRQHTA